MLCPECGEVNSDQAEFCGGCGSYIEISEAERHLKEVHKLYVETQQIIRASRVAANYEEYMEMTKGNSLAQEARAETMENEKTNPRGIFDEDDPS